LIETVDRLRAVTRSSDVVGRFGGDEFVVVCSGVSSPQMAEELGRRITERLHLPMRLGDHLVAPGASIGAAWAFVVAIDAETLLARADAAMYHAKRNRSSEVRVWDGTESEPVERVTA
jgi:diguanylate cyclase (GGDEF)-like protein